MKVFRTTVPSHKAGTALIWAIFCAVCGLFQRCAIDNPYIPYEEIEAAMETGIRNVAFINGNDIYLMHHFDSIPERLTFSPEETKTNVKISHDGKKLAYLNEEKQPVIIDSNGDVQEVLEGYTNPVEMDWAANNETLYFLIDNHVKFFGPALDIPPITFPETTYPNRKILSLSISKNNDLAYIFEATDFFNRGIIRMVIKFADKDQEDIVREGTWSQKFTYVNFSGEGRDLVIGAHRFSSYTPGRFERLEYYENGVLNGRLKSREGDMFICPSYKSGLKYIVTACKEADTPHFVLTAIAADGNFKGDIPKGYRVSALDWK